MTLTCKSAEAYQIPTRLEFSSSLFLFQAEDGIRDIGVTGVQTCALLISSRRRHTRYWRDWSSDVCSSDLCFKALAELKKLKSMSPMSAEATVVRNYLDWMLSIPWKQRTKVKRDLKAAQKVLDNDHYGLDKIKDRILEYLAVQLRTTKVKGPILCLVGPPGVGKTSLGKSVARATGR